MKRSQAALVGLCMLGTATLGSVAANAMTTTVIIRDAGMTPSVLTAQKGEKVDLAIRNQGTKTHNFVLPDFYIFTQNLSAGETVTVQFTPDKTGTFAYYSDAIGKPEPGIRGSLTVRP